MKCPHLTCNKEIYDMTGLQELQALQRHMRRKHKVLTDINDAMDIRDIAEKMEDGKAERKETGRK